MKFSILNSKKNTQAHCFKKQNFKTHGKKTISLLFSLGLIAVFLIACKPEVAPPPVEIDEPVKQLAKLSAEFLTLISSIAIDEDENNTYIRITENLETNPPTIIIDGLLDYPDFVSDPKTWTIPIQQIADVFTSVPEEIIVVEPNDESSAKEELSQSMFIKFGNRANLEYTVLLRFSAAPVETWFIPRNIDRFVEAELGIRKASLELNTQILTLSGLVNEEGTSPGSIRIDNLPLRYRAEPSSIEIVNPVGIEESTITSTPNSIEIFEVQGPEATRVENNVMTISIADIYLDGPPNRVAQFIAAINTEATSNELDVVNIQLEEDMNAVYPTVLLSGLYDAPDSLGSPKVWTITVQQDTEILSSLPTEIEAVEATDTEENPEQKRFYFTVDFGIETVTIEVKVLFEASPIELWFNPNTVRDYIQASFGTQEGSVTLSGNMLNVSGIFNERDPVLGSILISNIPPRYRTSVSSIEIPNPSGILESTVSPIPNSITIYEVSGEPAELVESNQLEVELEDVLLADPTDKTRVVIARISDTAYEAAGETTNLHIDVDRSAIDPTIIIDGIVDYPDFMGEAKNWNIPIEQEQGVFSSTPIEFNVMEPQDSSSNKEDMTFMLNVIANGDSAAYTVIFRFQAAAVSDWLVSDQVNTYFQAMLGDQIPELTLENNTLQVSGFINDKDTREGSITLQNLPLRYEASVTTIPIPNPLGTEALQYTTVPNSIEIYETRGAGAEKVETNVLEITIDDIEFIELRNKAELLIEHLSSSARSGTDTQDITGEEDEISVNPTVFINGMVDYPDVLGTPKDWDIQIQQEEGTFSTEPTELSFREPDDATTRPESISFTVRVTAQERSEDVEVIVQFAAAPVTDWFDASRVDDYIQVEFGGFSTILELERNTLSVTGLINDDSSDAGSMTIQNLPSRYRSSVSTIPIPNPVGTDMYSFTPNPNSIEIFAVRGEAATKVESSVHVINIQDIVFIRYEDKLQLLLERLSSIATSGTEQRAMTYVLDNSLASPTIIANGIIDYPDFMGTAKTWTIPIRQDAGFFSTDLTVLNAVEPSDGTTGPESQTFTVRATSQGSSIDVQVIVRFAAAPVSDWLVPNEVNKYFKVEYGAYSSTLSLVENSLSILGLVNGNDGVTGRLIVQNLPVRYRSSVSSIALPDPVGTELFRFTPNPNSIEIFAVEGEAETRVESSVREINIQDIVFEAYNDKIQLLLERLSANAVSGAEQRTMTYARDNTTVPPRIIADGIIDYPDLLRTAKSWTITIRQESGVFSTNPIVLNINEPNDATTRPESQTLTVRVTSQERSEDITVHIRFATVPVSNWLDSSRVNEFFRIEYGTYSSTLSLVNNSLRISGLVNGNDRITGSLIVQNLPPRYRATVTSIAIPDPVGTDMISFTPTPNSIEFFAVEGEDATRIDSTVHEIAIQDIVFAAYNDKLQLLLDRLSSTAISGIEQRTMTYTRDNTTLPPHIVADGIIDYPDFVGTAKSWSISIQQSVGLVSTNPTVLNVNEPNDASTNPESQTFTVSVTSQERTEDITVHMRFAAASVNDWLVPNKVNDFFKVEYGTYSSTLSLEGNSLTISGLVNDDDGLSGTLLVQNLPSRYRSNITSIAISDPVGTDTFRFIPNPNSIEIFAVEGEDATRVESSVVRYDVNDIVFEKLADLVDLFIDRASSSATSGSINVNLNYRKDQTSTTAAVLANTLIDYPDFLGTAKIWTIDIGQEQGVYSTSPTQLVLTEPIDSDDSAAVNPTINIDVTTQERTRRMTFSVFFEAAPIHSWLTPERLGEHFRVEFGSQTANLSLDRFSQPNSDASNASEIVGTTLNVIGLINEGGTATGLLRILNIPRRYKLSVESIVIPNPAGENAATVSLSPNRIRISELDYPLEDGIERGVNRVEITIPNIQMQQVGYLAPEDHIDIRNVSDNSIVSGIGLIEEGTATTKTLKVRGLTNSGTGTSDVAIPNKWVLNVSTVPNVFESVDGMPISIQLSDPAGVSETTITIPSAFAIRNNLGNTVTYNVEIFYEAENVQNWFRANVLSAITGGQSPTISFDTFSKNISLGGVQNIVNMSTNISTSSLFPSDFTLEQSPTVYSDPDGEGIGRIDNAQLGYIRITHRNNASNTMQYTVFLNANAFDVPLANDVQANFGTQTTSTVTIEDRTIRIAGFSNTTSLTTTGTVSITDASGTFTANPASINYTNRIHTLDHTVDVGDVQIRSGSAVVVYEVLVDLAIYIGYIIEFSASNLKDSPVKVGPLGGTLEISKVCEVFNPNIKITNNNIEQTSLQAKNLLGYFDEDGSYVSVNETEQTATSTDRTLRIVDDSDTLILSLDITTVFPLCKESDIEKTDEGYSLDTAPKLVLISKLMKNGVSGSDGVSYKESSYTLTRSIDLGEGLTPWSKDFETDSEGFYPLAMHDAFAGTFDCKGETINNLYIKLTNGSVGVGLISKLSSTGIVQNCGLVNVDFEVYQWVGAIVGFNEGTIIYSHSSGKISSTGGNSGGITGINNYGHISRSYSTMHIDGTGMGGISGYNRGTIEDVYSAITAEDTITQNRLGTGAGIVDTNNEVGVVRRALMIGSLDFTNYNDEHALVGSNQATIEDSYWLNTSGSSASSRDEDREPGAFRRTKEQLQVGAPITTGENSVYKTWSDSIWSFAAGRYPTLIIPETTE